jgi:hypothetical protein
MMKPFVHSNARTAWGKRRQGTPWYNLGFQTAIVAAITTNLELADVPRHASSAPSMKACERSCNFSAARPRLICCK